MPRYVLDASRSQFTVQTFASGMLWAFGHNPTIAIKDFTGSFLFSPETPDKPELDLVINAHSLESVDQIRPRDKVEIQDTMMQIMDVSSYPTVRYKATEAVATRLSESWFRILFHGYLSLRGVTKSQQVDAQLTIHEGEIRLSGSFQILQSAYNLQHFSAAGGLLITKDELKFKFDIHGNAVPEGSAA